MTIIRHLLNIAPCALNIKVHNFFEQQHFCELFFKKYIEIRLSLTKIYENK